MDSTKRSDLIDDSPASSLGRSTLLQAVKQGQLGPLSPFVAGLITVVLFLATLYVGWSVRSATQSLISDSINSVLVANVTGLDLWLTDQADETRRLSTDPRFAAWLRELVSQSGVESAGDFAAVRERFSSEIEERQYVGWALLNRAGIVMHSSLDESVGVSLALPRDTLETLNSGRATVTRPFLATLSGVEKEPRAIMCAVAPLKTDSGDQAFLATLIDPYEQFSEILTVARMGASGETYAIDAQGVLLSRSRFENQLRRGGLLDKSQLSPLNIHVRDPGVDIREQTLSNPDPRSWPMTLMADSVTRGGSDANITGYNDYRGVPVIGAWRWMPEYSMGIATEMDVDEAYAATKIFRNSYLALLALVLIACGSLLALASFLRRMDRSVEPKLGIARRLGQYELRHSIGRGGMGKVYLGEHRVLRRDVAIKVLEHTEVNERSLARFEREVRLSAKLQHPNTIEIYDFGQTPEGTFFYVMELIDGISLQQLIDYYGRQPPERVIYLLTQICGSIAEAHREGMIHRDIKPANVLITARAGLYDLVKVLDFGLAKQIDAETMQLTRTESLTGTPLYMSPESVRDASAASRLSDIYSIGSVGYMLLTAMAPYDGDSSADVCARKLHEDAIDPRERLDAELPDDLVRILMRCLRRDPEHRPKSVDELGKRLLRCRDAPKWNQQDAALWWKEIFDGPSLADMAALSEKETPASGGTKGDTEVNASPAAVSPIANAPTPR